MTDRDENIAKEEERLARALNKGGRSTKSFAVPSSTSPSPSPSPSTTINMNYNPRMEEVKRRVEEEEREKREKQAREAMLVRIHILIINHNII